MNTKNIIKKYLDMDKEIQFWTIKTSNKKSHESYMIFGKDENMRMVNDISHNIMIFKHVDKEGKKFIGEINFSIPEYADENEVEKIINEASYSANLIANPFYGLPDLKQSYEKLDNRDPEIMHNPLQAMDSIKNTIKTVIENEQNVELSSSEIFLTVTEYEFLDKLGNSYSYQDTDIMVEFVLLSGKNREVESHCLKREKFIEFLDLENTLKEYAGYARENSIATLPPSGKYNVVFGGEALQNFFDYYISQGSSMAFFNQYSSLKKGEPILAGATGDKLTIHSNPQLKGGTLSRISDNYGIPLKPFYQVKDNIFENIAASFRYAQYLKTEAKGPVTNIEIQPGSKNFEELIHQENTFYLTRFSTFTPNEITGAFSGEIRSGYFYKDGKMQPIKGGSVTGTMQKAFKEIYFSKEILQQRNYKGPKGIFVKDVDVAGE